ncbi:Uncharacterized protein TCM_026877 [Theobroma cacao]|uniref:Reverse transcriptase domain-containing protein n=1 Tax=Theobroma cacao TaxID=3641 RepID=A0A061GEI8_THECC|nr:Uncharacterized protein TCM_026877 [Theobroma cacao]
MQNALNQHDFPSLTTTHGMPSGRPPDPPHPPPTAPPPQTAPSPPAAETTSLLTTNPPTIWTKNPQLPPSHGCQQAAPTQFQPPTSPRSQKKSFLSIVSGQKPPVVPLSRDPFVFKDRPAAAFYEDEIQTLAQPLKLSLVGKFSRMPKLQDVRSAFKGIGLAGAYEVRWLDYKHILIHLTNEHDCNRVWTKQVWFIANQKMRVFKWTPEFEPEKESAMVPVWIAFPNLKAHLFEKSALLLIAKTVGKPLFVDEATANGSRPSVARVCIEYDCRKPPIDQVWIVVQNRETGTVTSGYPQKVEFSQMPAYCDHCCHVGHKEIDCIVLGNKDKPLGSSKSQFLRVLEAEKKKGYGGSSEKNLEKSKNPEKEKIARQEEPVSQRWQPVNKAGTSGTKDQQGKEIVSVLNRFQAISEDRDESQNRDETQSARTIGGVEVWSEGRENAGKLHVDMRKAHEMKEKGTRTGIDIVQVSDEQLNGKTDPSTAKPSSSNGSKATGKSEVGEILFRDSTEEQRADVEDRHGSSKQSGTKNEAPISVNLQTLEENTQPTVHENRKQQREKTEGNGEKEKSSGADTQDYAVEPSKQTADRSNKKKKDLQKLSNRKIEANPQDKDKYFLIKALEQKQLDNAPTTAGLDFSKVPTAVQQEPRPPTVSRDVQTVLHEKETHGQPGNTAEVEGISTELKEGDEQEPFDVHGLHGQKGGCFSETYLTEHPKDETKVKATVGKTAAGPLPKVNKQRDPTNNGSSKRDMEQTAIEGIEKTFGQQEMQEMAGENSNKHFYNPLPHGPVRSSEDQSVKNFTPLPKPSEAPRKILLKQHSSKKNVTNINEEENLAAQQETTNLNAATPQVWTSEKAADSHADANPLDQAADNLIQIVSQKREQVGRQTKGIVKTTLYGNEPLPIVKPTSTEEIRMTTPTEGEGTTADGPTPSPPRPELGDNILGMKAQESILEIGQDGTLLQKIGYAGTSQNLKNDNLEPSTQTTGWRQKKEQRIAQSVSRLQNVQSDILEGSGEHVPIEEEDTSQMQRQTEQTWVAINDVSSSDKMEDKAENLSNLESASSKCMLNKELSDIPSPSCNSHAELEVHPRERYRRHSDNVIPFENSFSSDTEDATISGGNEEESDDDSIPRELHSDVIFDHPQCLHVRLTSPWLEFPIFVTFVYAKCTRSERTLLWDCLRRLAADIEVPWLVGGDFNIILKREERLYGSAPHEGAMEDFASTLLDCGLLDGGFEGNPFTWTNNRMFQRLDRIVYNHHWINKFPITRIQHLNRDGSDHCPLLISCFNSSEKAPSSFRFQHAWVLHHDFKTSVESNWNLPINGSGLQAFWSKQHRLKQHLKWWNKVMFGDIFSKLKEAEKRVEECEILHQNEQTVESIIKLNKSYAQLNKQLNIEEIFWKQKSGVKWVVEGERNTKFFHTRMQKKRIRSHIFKVQEPDGRWIEDQEQLKQSAIKYFSSLLKFEPCDDSRFQRSLIPSIISNSENELLCAEPNLQEVKDAVFGIDPESAAGPDGFSSYFYQQCWNIIAHDLLDAVRDFFHGANIPRGVTSTTLILLPKKPSASKWSDFRPISLCTVMNKIITKLLSNRLAKILPSIITENQSGFVGGRLISDNILLAQELIGKLNTKSRGGNLALKLDMMKAYDRLDWSFLIKVLQHFGFNDQWIGMIQKCISNCWFSLLLNGRTEGYFKFERGLRQGDPISPQLFLIAAEYLSRGLNALYEQYPSLHYSTGVSIPVSHLAFADDVLIFTNGSKSALQRILAFLQEYEEISRQRINAQKSCFVTHTNVSSSRRQIIAQTTGFNHQLLPITYLGAPLYKGHKKVILFNDLVAKIEERITGWENKILSPGGRITLLKSVLTSLPIYLFQVLKPPVCVLERINRIFNSFLWGGSAASKKIHWTSWAKISLPVKEGGLDIRSLAEVFEAFSMKLWWRFRTTDSLWTRFMRMKYCRGQLPMHTQPKLHDSQTWKRMVASSAITEQNMRWRVGQGNLFFWHDCWMGETPLISSNHEFSLSMVQVCDFFMNNSWDIEKLKTVLQQEVVDEIAKIPIDAMSKDEAYWAPTPNGEFSTKSAWQLIRKREVVNPVFNFIWHKAIPLTTSFFLWRLLHDWIPVELRMKSKGFQLASRCRCCRSEESIIHVMWDNPVAVQPGHIRTLIPIFTLWFLWVERNDAKHRNLGQQLLEWQWKGDKQIAQEWGITFQAKSLPPPKVFCWHKPSNGEFKLNVDGSAKLSQNAAGGGVLRDHAGVMIFGFSENLGIQNSLKAELLALYRGLILCRDYNIRRLWIEMDATSVIRLLQGNHRGPHAIRYLLGSIRQLLSHFSFRLTHIFREGNQAADFLANRGHEHQSLQVITVAQGKLRGMLRLDQTSLPYVRFK